MKIRKNGLIGKIKNMVNDFLFEHEEIDIAIGKIRNCFMMTNKREEEFNQNLVFYEFDVYASVDYIRVLKLIDCGYTIIVNYSDLSGIYRDIFLLDLKKGLMIRGMHINEVSENVILCAQPEVNVTNDIERAKGPAKIYRFPINKDFN